MISVAVETDTNRSSKFARPLSVALFVLGVTMAATSVLGPVALGAMVYRTSPTTLNQLVGSDTAILIVIAPLTLVAAFLAFRGHASAPLLATGLGAFAVYTYAQVIIGQEYLRLPGNVERFFPLLLTVFILAEVALVLGWVSAPRDLPPLGPRLERWVAVVLLLVATFLVFGQHLRPMLIAWQDPEQLTEYASSPTPFWLVKLMDLGIIVPSLAVTGVGLWRRTAWARRVAYLLLTGYTCLAVSVTTMAVVMIINDDPDASAGLAAGFGVFAAVLIILTVLLYRPLFTHRPRL